MFKTLTLATAVALATTSAHADAFTDAVLAKFQEREFDFIEIKEGLTQLKVEAIRGDQKLEVIYDRASGTILKQEQERADADEIGRSGVEIDRRSRDFIDEDDLARVSDDDDDRRSGRDSDDDDDDRRSGRDDDDDEDRRSSRDDDDDNYDDDDRRSGHGGGNEDDDSDDD